jgi:hypothetical protein
MEELEVFKWSQPPFSLPHLIYTQHTNPAESTDTATLNSFLIFLSIILLFGIIFLFFIFLGGLLN